MPGIEVKDPRDIDGTVNDRFDKLRRAESADNEADYNQDYIDKGVKEAEDYVNNADTGSWTTNRDLSRAEKTEQRKHKMKKLLKVGGPSAAVLTLLLGGGSLIGMFASTGLLLVNLSEVVTNKFDYQLVNLNNRQMKLFHSRLNDTAGCKIAGSFLCKYKTFSDKEIANFEKAGITVEGKSTLFGRTKVKSLSFEGKIIPAKDLLSTVASNPKFANAMNNAFNLRYTTKVDSTWTKMAKFFGIKKSAPFAGDKTDAERKATAKKTLLGGSEPDITAESPKIGDACAGAAESCATDAKTAADDIQNKVGELKAESSGPTDGASQIAKDFSEGKINTGSAAAKFGRFVGIFGAAQEACTVYSAINMASNVAKLVKVAQMARYAMIFMTTASMIKAGTATPDDVNFAGNELMNTVKDSAGNVSKTATEGAGYQYVTGNSNSIDAAAMGAVAGVNFTTDIQSTIDRFFGANGGGRKNVAATCRVLSSTAIQIASIGIGLAFLPGAAIKGAIQVVGFEVVNQFVLPYLASTIGEIAAGNIIADSTTADKKGDIIVSGMGASLSTEANYGGNAILTNDQAKSFLNQKDQVMAMYANYDRATLSPFDASSPNTFLGSIMTSFAPYLYSGNTPMAALRAFGSILTASMKNFMTPAMATTGYVNTCNDPLLKDIGDSGIAADPFCNPIVGIPPEYTNHDGDQIQQELESAGFVDETGNPTNSMGGDGKGVAGTGLGYQDFVDKCIERSTAYGVDLEGDTVDDSICIITSQSKADLYLHMTDMRLLDINDIQPAADQSSSNDGSVSSGSIVDNSSPIDNSQPPSYCTDGSLPANDPAQIACKGYQFTGYGYLWGGNHSAVPSVFMNNFHDGKYPLGTPILDCSSFVRMSIFDATSIDVGLISTADMLSNHHFTVLSSFTDAKPGDVVWKNGHTEVVVRNDTENKVFYTVGAHTDGIPISEQIGPDSKSYSYYTKVLRVN